MEWLVNLVRMHYFLWRIYIYYVCLVVSGWRDWSTWSECTTFCDVFIFTMFVWWSVNAVIGQPVQNALLSVTYLYVLCLFDDQWMADGVIGQPGQNALLSVTYLYLLCLFDGQLMQWLVNLFRMHYFLWRIYMYYACLMISGWRMEWLVNLVRLHYFLWRIYIYYVCLMVSGWSDWSTWSECTTFCDVFIFIMFVWWSAGGVISQPGQNTLLSVTYLYLLCLFDGQRMEWLVNLVRMHHFLWRIYIYYVCLMVSGWRMEWLVSLVRMHYFLRRIYIYYVCLMVSGWSDWSAWSECTTFCDVFIFIMFVWWSVDGGWSDWSAWSECTTFCGGTRQQRHRTCSVPPARTTGSTCPGDDIDYYTCPKGTLDK